MYPSYTLEIEFTDGVWTDVSSYLRSGNTKRGKSFAIERNAPGRMTVVLANELRIFDPEYLMNISPGNVLPDKRIRLSVTHNAITYPVFSGFIERISQMYDPPRRATARLECSDGLAKLANGLLGSAWETTMRKYSTRLWFRLNEQGKGTKVFDRSPNNFYGVYAGAGGAVTGTDSLIAYDQDPATRFTATSKYVQLGNANDLAMAAPWSISFMLNVPVIPTSAAYILRGNDLNNGLNIWMDTNGRINAEIRVAGVQTLYARTFDTYHGVPPVTATHMITLVAQAGVGLKIHQWGGDNTNTGVAVGTGGTVPVALHSMGYTPADMILDEFVVFGHALTNTELAELAFGLRGWDADAPFNRIHRILDAMGWPALDRDITLDYDEFLRGTGLGVTALAHLEAIAATMIARMFVERDGTLRVLSREDHSAIPYTASQAILGDAPGEVGYTQIGNYSLDLGAVENVTRRKWRGFGATEDTLIQVEDAASIGLYGLRYGQEIDSEYHAIDSEEELALHRLGRLKDATPSVEGLEMTPDSNAQWAVALDRELGDRITWRRRPQNVGAMIQREVIIEGISHSFGPKKWKTTLLIDATDAPPTMYWTEDNWGENWA